jgi:hypothetical protein
MARAMATDMMMTMTITSIVISGRDINASYRRNICVDPTTAATFTLADTGAGTGFMFDPTTIVVIRHTTVITAMMMMIIDTEGVVPDGARQP